MSTLRTPFQFDSGKTAKVTTITDIVRQKAVDVLSTSNLERVMNSNYGAGANELIFEIMDPLVFEDFKQDALLELGRYVSGVIFKDLQISFNDSGLTETTVYITVYYQIPPLGVTSTTLTLTGS